MIEDVGAERTRHDPRRKLNDRHIALAEHGAGRNFHSDDTATQ